MSDDVKKEKHPDPIPRGCLCHPVTPHLVLWGIDHHRASTEIREKAHMDKDRIRGFIETCISEEGVVSAIPLCTCNRTELYVEVREGLPYTDLILGALNQAGIDQTIFEGEYIYRHSDLDAVRHLYRVNSGLESMMLGETQITGQVKDAYQYAREIHTLGPMILRAFQGAFRAGKRVRTRTRIDAGAVNISYAAVELARKFFSDLSACSALLVGAGETGSLAARHFLQTGIGGLTVINRSRDRADRLVQELTDEGAPVVHSRSFSYLAEGIGCHDIVLTATGSQEPVILPEMVEAAGRHRRGKPLFIIDIAVPRDVHPEAGSFEGVYVFDIDALDGIVKSNLAARRNEVVHAEKIIEHELKEFTRWMQDLELRPTVAQFKALLESLKEKEMRRIPGDASQETAAAVDESLQRFIKNLVGRSMSRLKTSTSHEERAKDLDSLRRIFELEE